MQSIEKKYDWYNLILTGWFEINAQSVALHPLYQQSVKFIGL